MKKIFPLVLLFFLSIVITGCNKQISAIKNDNSNITNQTATSKINNKNSSEYPMSSAEQIADKLEVYYFHRTARCYSCKTIGQYVKETMEQKYNEQIKAGLIDFRELNIELPENKEIAKKFKASGSSLFINRIIEGKDNIEQDTDVWRLLRNEAQFKSHLENKINSYLDL